MTRDELTKYFNDRYGTGEWPARFEVDAETYANVVQAYFDIFSVPYEKKNQLIYITIGPRNGILHKNVELILKKKVTGTV